MCHQTKNLNSTSESVVHFFSCKTFNKQHIESTEEFWVRFSNYKCLTKLSKGQGEFVSTKENLFGKSD